MPVSAIERLASPRMASAAPLATGVTATMLGVACISASTACQLSIERVRWARGCTWRASASPPVASEGRVISSNGLTTTCGWVPNVRLMVLPAGLR